jgi:hypothetical protein
MQHVGAMQILGRNRPHRAHKTKRNKTQHNVSDNTTGNQTNNANKTRVLLQTTRGEDEPNIVFMRKGTFISVIFLNANTNSLWWAISKKIVLSLYWFEFGFVTGLCKHNISQEFYFEMGVVKSFVQMWSYPSASIYKW